MKNLIRKIRLWLFYLFAAPAKSHQPRKLQPTEAEDALRITLTDASEEKRKFWTEWSKPENIAARVKKYEEDAPKALEKAQAMAKFAREALGLKEEDLDLPPLPDMNILPKHMHNQQPSTLRRLLAHDGWEYDRDKAKWINRVERLKSTLPKEKIEELSFDLQVAGIEC